MQSSETRQRSWHGQEDGELARAVASKADDSTGAEAELCARFARRVRLYGIRHLGSEDAAQDLVQDVLLVVLQKLRDGEVRQPHRIASFVLGVARMMVHERYRGRRREGDQQRAEVPAVDPPEVDRLAEEQLRRCLEGLTERERTILMLTYYAEQSSRAIASSLGLDAGHVRVIRHRGMTSLRDCVGADRELLQ